jgi:hypothetical protein
MTIQTWQWIILIVFSLVLIIITPYVKENSGFYKGSSKKSVEARLHHAYIQFSYFMDIC